MACVQHTCKIFNNSHIHTATHVLIFICSCNTHIYSMQLANNYLELTNLLFNTADIRKTGIKICQRQKKKKSILYLD